MTIGDGIGFAALVLGFCWYCTLVTVRLYLSDIAAAVRALKEPAPAPRGEGG